MIFVFSCKFKVVGYTFRFRQHFVRNVKDKMSCESDREGSDDQQENVSHNSREKSASSHGSSKQRVRKKSMSRSRTPHSHSRSRSYSKSRSRSRSRRHHRNKKSRSKSRTPKRRYSKSRRSHSKSPVSSRRRYLGSRENPEPCRCIGVFGLSLYTKERDLKEVFSKYGTVENIQIVYDRQSGRSRGFAFVYFDSIEDAEEAKERCNGLEIDGRKIRVDYSVTKRAHTPTPGIYMGKPNFPKYGGNYRGRSPSSNYHGRRYSRSRSRSYSPRLEERNKRMKN
ncbi:transformer-2 protein homolog beta-like [Limulus polyphemus]|uniref:Transformer-2 protein homolog beta-like n=1 Tax=Limulus polyphemus TaxID=6850 RepID=A0ABM1B0S0_LIMPO|nr:transformer-2 protein homolog beta-like [Limulus polyphemus]